MATTTAHRSTLAPSVGKATTISGVAATRLAALAGGVFFALIVVSANLRSGAPSATDSGQEIFDYVAEHAGRLQFGAVLMGLAMAAALVWLSGLFRVVRGAEGGAAGSALAALAGGVLAAAGTTITALLQGTIALRIDELGPSGVGVWWTLYLLSTGATLLGLLVLIGATTVASWPRRIFARWFTIASALLAFLSLVGAFTIGYDSSGIQAVAGIAVLLDSVWILLVSLFLWRHPALGNPPTPDAARATGSETPSPG
jgi:hypothetical protein